MTEIVNDSKLKAPVICFLGHVDAGKTSLKDCITKKLTKEEGDITQNIGATFVTKKDIQKIAGTIKGKFKIDDKFPGLLVIDTPGHAAFTNLRQQGSSHCDLGIVVIDINQGVQPQTIESVEMLKEKKVPFIVALTKIDRIDQWINSKEPNLRKALKINKNCKDTLNYMIEDIKYELNKLEIQSEFYFNNKKPESIYSLIPLSSHTGEGIPDLVSMISYLSLNWMSKKITYRENIKASIVNCVFDKKIGWTIDCIISNGTIHKNQEFIVTTLTNPKKIKVKNLIIKSNGKLVNVENVKASNAFRIIASNLEGCLSGTKLRLVNDNEEELIQKANQDMINFWDKFEFKDEGGILVASSLGELEAAYSLFQKEKLNISKAFIGDLREGFLDRISIMLDKQEKKMYKTIYYFGSLSSKIENYLKFKNFHLIARPVIYHLINNIQEYNETCEEEVRNDLISNGESIYPALCSIVPNCIFNSGGNQEIVIGLKVRSGKIKKESIFAAINSSNEVVKLGKVLSIQSDNKDVEEACIGDKVAVKFENPDKKSIGRHFEENSEIVSLLTRKRIDILKEHFKSILTKKDWFLVRDLKNKLKIN